MLHEQNINGRQFTIQWNGPGWYGPQQIQDGEHWTNAVLDTDNVQAWDVSRYGRHLGTLRHFRTVEDWKALS